MDYRTGLTNLRKYSKGTEWQDEFNLFEAQLRENLKDEQQYGPSEQTRRDRARIVSNLNILARREVGVSFNSLCVAQSSHIVVFNRATDSEIVNEIRRLRSILSDKSQADREDSERLWQAVQQGRVDQAEISQTVDALRRWARSVQHIGLPTDPELRAAILNMSQSTDGVDGMYNYLHFALPLLPGILGVESEIDLNKLWAEIKQRWGRAEDG